MSHWNPSSSGSERSPAENPNADDTDPIPRVSERPEPDDEPPAWPGQRGWDYQPPPVDPHEQPPIWAGPQPPMAPWEDQQPPKAFLRQQPQPPRSGGGRGVILVLALLVILAGGAAVVTVQLLAHGGKRAAAHRAGGSQAPPSARTTPAGTAPVSPTASPAHPRVAVAPAAAGDPAAPAAVIFLTEYFRAINTHDYLAYRRLLDAQTRLVETAQKFSTGFRSTRDSGATLQKLSLAPDGRLAATVTFTSHQLPADSPDQTVCTRWRITLYLERAGAGYVIGPPPDGYRASHRPC